MVYVGNAYIASVLFQTVQDISSGFSCRAVNQNAVPRHFREFNGSSW
jgi:hypothetical protein